MNISMKFGGGGWPIRERLPKECCHNVLFRPPSVICEAVDGE